jgi:hypothetical protein
MRLALISIPLLIVAAATAADYPRYDIRRAKSEPAIDGRLNDPAWKGVPSVSKFNFNWYKTGRKEQTQVRLLWDDRNLYVGFYCQDRHIYAEVTKRHGPVSLDDCVEIFISPNPDKFKNYYGFEMNVIGTMLNFVHADWWTGGPHWEPEGVRYRATFQGMPKKEEAPTDKDWVFELAIPFANFSHDAAHTPPRDGDVWRLNLNRDGGKTDAQYSTWSPVHTPKPNFHTPEDFGYVKFVNR